MKKILTKKCELCSLDFEYNSGNKRESNKRFCSSFCAKRNNGLSNKGNKHTDEWKKMMSEKNSGENNPFYNKKHSIESIQKMSESSLWKESDYKYCHMSEKEKEIFDGIMISDGSLSVSRISGRLTLGFMYLETIERIVKDLPSISFLKPWEYNTYNKKYNRYYKHYFNKSNSFRDLLNEYNRWYKDGIKIIPNDINLSNIMLYWWYVCDGYINRGNVYLCTECFMEDDIKNVSIKLNNIGYKNSITTKNRIRIFKKDSNIFLKNISKNVEIQKEYLYKWEIEKKLD